MDSQIKFSALLQTINIINNSRNAIVDFYDEFFSDLSRIPKKTIDTGMENPHKFLANVPPERIVRLNAKKCTLLNSLRIYFNDCLQ